MNFWTCQTCKHENEFQSLKCQLCSTKPKHRAKFIFDIFSHTNRSSFGARESTKDKNWCKKSNKNSGNSKGQTVGYSYNDKYQSNDQTQIKKKGSANNDHKFEIALDQFPPLPKLLPILIVEKKGGKNHLLEEKMKAKSSSRISNEAVDAIAAVTDRKRINFQERNELNHEFPSNDPPRGKMQTEFKFCGSCERPVVISEIKRLEGSIFCTKCYDTRKSERITRTALNDEESPNDHEEDEEGNFEEVSSVDGNDGSTFKRSSVISDSDDEIDSSEYQNAEEGYSKDDNISPGTQKKQNEDNEGSNNGSDDEKRDDRREKISEESISTGILTHIPTVVVEAISSILPRSKAPDVVNQCNKCGEQNSEENRSCVKCGNVFINLLVKVKSKKNDNGCINI